LIVGEGVIKCYKRLQIIGTLSLLGGQEGTLVISAMEPLGFSVGNEKMLKPIKHQREVDLIQEEIRDLIFPGQLKPGERLMPERKMANSLKVERPAIREAIQKLIKSNLVETRRGSGTFVARMESQKQTGPFI
jgi:DNA-binding transcriptional regulator YhcF (GntR family)